jgi:hypothetical protein
MAQSSQSCPWSFDLHDFALDLYSIPRARFGHISFFCEFSEMNLCNRRKQAPRNDLFDCLEDRVLLDGAPSRAPAAEVRVVPAAKTAPKTLHLTLKGNVQLINLSPQTYQMSLTGNARGLGHLQFAGTYVTTGQTTTNGHEVVQISQGNTSLTDSEGGLLYFTFSGETVYSGRAGHFTATDKLSGDVTGGAGQFAGMIGTMHATGTAKQHAPFQLTLNVRLQPLE